MYKRRKLSKWYKEWELDRLYEDNPAKEDIDYLIKLLKERDFRRKLIKKEMKANKKIDKENNFIFGIILILVILLLYYICRIAFY